MKTVQDTFNTFKQALTPLYDGVEANAITALVLNEFTGFSKAKLRAFPETALTDNQSIKLKQVLEQLQTGKPVQYILGHTEFYGLTFEVNPAVLIPRPETEELVSWILESAPSTSASIIDIGTGSGCIAITLKHELPGANVSALDISADALQTAERNALSNHANLIFIKADILACEAQLLEYKLDVIVSNPPYVTETDKRQMHNNVTGFEPHTALFVPENDPLLFYEAIANFALQNLKPGGLLFFEINENYGEAIVELLAAKTFYSIVLRKDMSGRNRMIKCSG